MGIIELDNKTVFWCLSLLLASFFLTRLLILKNNNNKNKLRLIYRRIFDTFLIPFKNKFLLQTVPFLFIYI
jgi:hypothetical protein